MLLGPGALPTLVVLGAMKCGTSALHRYLTLHPQVSTSSPKELDFFLTEKNWDRGLEWYAGHFDPTKPARVEASPNYTAFPKHAGVVRRMAEVLPQARFVYLVRDPIDRMASHWVHNVHRGRVDPTAPLAPVLLDPSGTYLSRSSYGAQLRQFTEHYPSTRILILDQRELFAERARTLRRVFDFAGVDPDFTDPAFAAPHGRTSRMIRPTPLGYRVRAVCPRFLWWRIRDHHWLTRPIARPDVRAALPDKVLEELRADAAEFAAVTGLDTRHWSIWR